MMKQMVLVFLFLFTVACTALTGDEERELINDTARAAEITQIASERPLTQQEREEIERLRNRIQELHDKAQEGDVDWDALMNIGLSIAAALGLVRLQRGPAKKLETDEVLALRAILTERKMGPQNTSGV